MQEKVVRTKMAAAMLKGLNSCVAENRNPGRLGRHIVTANAAGVGVVYHQRAKRSVTK